MKKVISVVSAIFLFLSIMLIGLFSMGTTAWTSVAAGDCASGNSDAESHRYTNDYDTTCNVCNEELTLSSVTGVYDLFTYRIDPDGDGGKVTITDVTTIANGEVVIPSTIDGLSVTAIGANAFYDCSEITSITVPNSVTSIGDSAFRNCTSLENITLPFVGSSRNASRTYDAVFGYIFGYADSRESETTFQEYTTQSHRFLGKYYYIPSNLKSVTITDATSIPFGAFSNCSELTSITIPNGLHTISAYAFDNCSGLTSITLPNGLTTISDYAFYDCSGLTSITFPDSLTSIGSRAFCNCGGFTSITIPDSVISISYAAFEGCWNLRTIVVPFVGSSPTSNGYLTHIFGTNVPHLKTVVVSDKCTSMSSTAFSGIVYIENLVIPFVGQNADGTGYSNFGYIFGADDDSCPYYDHAQCVPSSLKNVIVTGSNSISSYAFYDCNNLQSVVFSGNVKIFGDYVFGNCTGLKKVTLPASLTKIGSRTFYDCVNLDDVYFLGSESQKNINISYGNDMIVDTAEWHYNSCYGTEVHIYEDEKCVVCNSQKYVMGDIYDVSGIVSSFGSESDIVTLQLIPEGMNGMFYETTVIGNDKTYCFTGVVPGNYTLRVMKNKHITREYEITVDSQSVIQNVALELIQVKGTWMKDNIGWWYKNVDGSYPKACWKEIDNVWYYFNASGYIVTGWKTIGGTWYYFDGSGAMTTGWLKSCGVWYYFNDSGGMVTNWQSISGTWYYFNGSGAMVTGWQSIGGTWYYFSGSGAMVTGWQSIGGTWYYFNGSGAMVTGWQSIGGTWYYFSGSGAMVTGWQSIGGTWYYFHASGVMATSQWVGNYYLQADGSMATNKWIGNYYVGADGVWIP